MGLDNLILLSYNIIVISHIRFVYMLEANLYLLVTMNSIIA